MIANMDAWLRKGTLPPPSSYPHLSDGTLVPLAKYAFPHLPGVNTPHEANTGERLDFGPNFKRGIISLQPPRLGKPFPTLVPQVDSDGNEREGVRSPEFTAPLATITGWNLRDPSIGAPGERVSFEGSWIPFAKTAEDRRRAGDPRPSIAERYTSEDDYMNRYTAALDELIKEHWILPEDREPFLTRAKEEWTEATR